MLNLVGLREAHRRPFLTAAVLTSSLLGTSAVAQPEPEGMPRGNLRVGASSDSDLSRPVLCGEIYIAYGISAESCGSGSGILFPEASRELVHFRAKWLLHEAPLASGRLQVQPGIGLAELEVGPDEAGLALGGPSSAGNSTTGPEASVSARWLHPLGAGVQFLANASVGAAYLHYATDLAVPQARLQPFASIEMGLGF